MSTATAETAASSARWPDLPFDLLRDVSRRLNDATDYVRFHAVCKSWRDTLPPPACRPTFLPWLLSRRDDDTGHRKARCVFSSKSSRFSSYVRDRGWAIAADDGAAACCLFTATCPDDEFNDNLAGSAASVALPPYTNEIKSWVERASGMVSGDGTVFLYAFGLVQRTQSDVPIFMALLRPGDAAWTSVNRNDLYLSTSDIDTCSIAYHDGNIVQCKDTLWQNSWTIVSTKVGGGKWSGCIDGVRQSRGYLVESRGELLWVFVHVNTIGHYYTDLGSLLDALAVSVFALWYEGGEPQWVKRDRRSFADRILFLGRQGSFAVDAAQFGVVGGCAYFVDRRALYSGAWSMSSLKRCSVYKYSFLDDTSELVEQLPAKWNDFRCMWLTPKPEIASTEEIGEKLKPSQVNSTEESGSYFTIYVGNLPRKVDNCRLRQFFSKHGKVADARVMVDRKTRRSRGFGFVTMENTGVDDEPAAHAVVKYFHGKRLDGRPLLVKIADQ